MSKVLHYCNPGIGDASWIHKDKEVKAILAKFPAGSHKLEQSSTGCMCGGYNYTVTCVSHGDEIEKALDALHMGRAHQNFAEDDEE